MKDIIKIIVIGIFLLIAIYLVGILILVGKML